MKFRILALCVIAAMTAGPVLTMSCARHEPKKQAAAETRYYQCPMHPQIIRDKPGACPICGMDLVPVDKGKNMPSGSRDTAVAIDPAVVQNMGVVTEPAAVRSIAREIRPGATIELNEAGISIVTTKIMGWVEKLYVDYTGQAVRKGQTLFELYSPDLVSTQEEFLQALRYEKGLPAGASPDAIKGAHDLVESSRRRLVNWDISESAIAEIARRGTPQRTMGIAAPSGGIVLEKTVLSGQNVLPGAPLYKIADLSTVWAVASVYQEDLPFIKTGMKAAVSVPSLPGREFDGVVQFVSPVLDPVAKTASVRIAVRNTPDIAIKPQMFASVKIVSPSPVKAVSVPEQAVIHSGTRDIVIVALGSGRFSPREVKLGPRGSGYVQVLEGIAEGQSIVTSSQFLIDAESNLKAAIAQMTRDR
jgi:RND family efflux transporter MFP subunit